MQAVKVNFEAFLSQSLVCSWRRRRAQCWGSPLRCTSALPKSNFFFFSFSSSPSSPPVYLARCEDCPDRMKGWVCQSWTASGRCGHGIPFGSRLALTLRVTRLFSLFFSGSPWPLTFFFFFFYLYWSLPMRLLLPRVRPLIQIFPPQCLLATQSRIAHPGHY